MNQIMYDIPSIVIAAVLFASMAVVIELGFRLGRLFERETTGTIKGHVTGIQGALLGILALLLGFTFSLSLNRHDTRSIVVVKESNAIGTAYLRAGLLPEPVCRKARIDLRNYIGFRIEEGRINLANSDERAALIAQTNERFYQMWTDAVAAARQDPNPVTTGLYLQALNEMFDAFGERDAALNRHVPEVVLFLLYGTFLMAGAIVGFTSGIHGHRASFATYVMVALIVLLVFIIIDLDRPRRGLIEVDQQSMLDLQAAIVAHP